MHDNGFQAFPGTYDGLEADFELGFKFDFGQPDNEEEKEVHGYRIVACAEPVLALYLSVRRKSSLGESVTLHYYLTRSEFSGGLAPNDEDKKRLLEMSHEMIVADLGALKDGQAPERLKALRLTAIPNRGNQTTSRKS